MSARYACARREWKIPDYSFDKTPRWLNCFRDLDENMCCPKHGADVKDQGREPETKENK